MIGVRNKNSACTSLRAPARLGTATFEVTLTPVGHTRRLMGQDGAALYPLCVPAAHTTVDGVAAAVARPPTVEPYDERPALLPAREPVRNDREHQRETAWPQIDWERQLVVDACESGAEGWRQE